MLNNYKMRWTYSALWLGVLMMRVKFEFNRARVESLTFRVELDLESCLLEPSSTRLDSLTFRVELKLESSFDRVLIESSPSSSRVVSFH